jgi:hypothetical protein
MYSYFKLCQSRSLKTLSIRRTRLNANGCAPDKRTEHATKIAFIRREVGRLWQG